MSDDNNTCDSSDCCSSRIVLFTILLLITECLLKKSLFKPVLIATSYVICKFEHIARWAMFH